MSPHPPITFAADGSHLDAWPCFPEACSIWVAGSRYGSALLPLVAGQVNHLNRLVVDAVTAIQVASEAPPVIVSQPMCPPGPASVTAGGSGTDAWSGLPVYFRCVVVSSTDITWYVSFGGHIFRRHGSASINPGFTIGSFFAAANPENSTYSLSIAVDCIRFT